LGSCKAVNVVVVGGGLQDTFDLAQDHQTLVEQVNRESVTTPERIQITWPWVGFFQVRLTQSPDKMMVSVGSFYVGSCGLNPQALCNMAIDLDPAPNVGLGVQSKGRLRRIGQRHVVEHYEIVNVYNFHSSVIQKTLEKAVPGILAERNIFMSQEDTVLGDQDFAINIGGWYQVNDELVRAPDERLTSIDPRIKLTTFQWLKALQNNKVHSAYHDSLSTRIALGKEMPPLCMYFACFI
jgi:hypothetical protein